MRILFPYLARWRSANWSRYHHLLSALASRGHEIVVVQPPARPAALETNFLEMDGPVPPGITLVELDLPGTLWRANFPLDKFFKKGLATLASRRATRRLAEEIPFDVLLLYNIPQLILARQIPALLVVDIADDLMAMVQEEATRWSHRMLVPAAGRALGELIGAADLVITPSSVLAEQMAGIAKVLSNGADFRAARQADGAEIRARFLKPIVGYVGAIEYFFDGDLFLDVARRLPHVTMLLVGAGRELPGLREEIRRRRLSNVQCIGAVPYHDALNYMAACDVTLIPFRPGSVANAASPLKLFEYLALRKPVVSSPAAELTRIAADWAFFAVGPNEWADLVNRVVAGPEIASDKIARGFEAVQVRFRWDLLAVEFESLVAAAAAQHNGELSHSTSRRKSDPQASPERAG